MLVNTILSVFPEYPRPVCPRRLWWGWRFNTCYFGFWFRFRFCLGYYDGWRPPAFRFGRWCRLFFFLLFLFLFFFFFFFFFWFFLWWWNGNGFTDSLWFMFGTGWPSTSSLRWRGLFDRCWDVSAGGISSPGFNSRMAIILLSRIKNIVGRIFSRNKSRKREDVLLNSELRPYNRLFGNQYF